LSAITIAKKHITHSVIGPEGPLNSSPKAFKESVPFSMGNWKACSIIATIAKAEIPAQGSPRFCAGAD
jgi:hypothetical protein